MAQTVMDRRENVIRQHTHVVRQTRHVEPARPAQGASHDHSHAHDHPQSKSREPWIQFRGPSAFAWRRRTLGVRDLPDELEGLRVLHVSDLHTRHYWPAAYDILLERIAIDPPDLLLVTGDFVESKRDHTPALPHVKRLIAGFRARLGCFGTLGNHDLYHFAPQLDHTNVSLLEGARQLLHRGNAAIELIGLPGVHRDDYDETFVRTLPPRASRTLRIVMSHFPEHLTRTRGLDPDLFLTGHTHGGQVCLPGGVPIITHCHLPRPLRRGVHRIGRTWHVVNHGIGYSGLPLRTFCASEVLELTLKSEI
jgi:predicted MPP superfamily phosphohydrolase